MPDINGNVSECRETPPPEAYTLKKAAEILGVTDAALYDRAKRGTISVFEKNGQKMVTREEVERVNKEREKRAAKKNDYVRKQKAKQKVAEKKADNDQRKAEHGAFKMKEHLDTIPVYKKGETAEVEDRYFETIIPMDTIPADTKFIKIDMISCERRLTMYFDNVSIGITFRK